MITIQKYLNTENEKIILNAFNLCLMDFKNRGVGYCKLKGLEFNLILLRDLSKLHFSIISHSGEIKILCELIPTKQLINKYKKEFLKNE